MAWRIGIDIGGTFTDVAMVEETTGQIGIAKVLTTPHDFGQAVIDGIRQGLDQNGIDPANVSLLSHATTVVTNALLEHKGARAGFIATRGFRDLLELRRSSRIDLYDLFQDAPSVIVPRRWRYEITERVDAQGAVVTELAEGEVAGIVEAIRNASLETVAVSLMFSFLNDSHERRLGAMLREALPGVAVFLSCDVLPEIREFERASTTAVCAYVGPLLAGYLDRLQRATTSLGLPDLHVMGSSGGVIDIAEALRMPAAVVESGPAAGVIAAALAGRQLGLTEIISFDMGGTTAKASVISGGEISVTAEYEVGGSGNANRWQNGTGHPIRVPVIDLAEVSAGGGSIAWIDPGGSLRVGPRSAGADPGPAGYGAGGTSPTVTDADFVLGYLDRESLLGGALTVDIEAAERAIDQAIATPLGLTVPEAAARIAEIVNANMAEALRIVSVERGHDARAFSLIAFGGAGPVHAAALAEELQIPEVIIPPVPGAFSALGLVASDLKRDYVRTLYADLGTVDPARVAAMFGAMETSGQEMLDNARVPPERRAMPRQADLRYRRQAYELTVPIADGPITRESLDAAMAAFHAKHELTYGHANRNEPVQLVNLRLTAIGRLPSLMLAQHGDMAQMRIRERQVWFAATGFANTPVLWRPGLPAGAVITGPVIVEAVDFDGGDPSGLDRTRGRKRLYPHDENRAMMQLSGVRVLDLTRVLSGPFCTALLGDLGADVLKVEAPDGDPVRRQGAMRDGVSFYFTQFNRNKRSIRLDLRKPEGREILTALIERSDVLVENFRPGVLARLGFSMERLQALRPSLVVCSINGFGGTGPYKDRPAFDFIAQAMSGFMSVNGTEGGEPLRSGVPISDLVAGLYAALAITAAVMRARETGKGEIVEVALTNAMVSMLAYIATDYFATGVTPPRSGNDHPIAAPYGLFPTRDGRVALAPPGDEFFGRLMDVLEMPELKTDPLYATQPMRVANRERINAIVGGKLVLNTTDFWVRTLNAAGVPCGPVHAVADVFRDPQILAQEMVMEVEQPGGQTVRMLGFPMKFAADPCAVRRLAPGFGEHTDEVLDELGYTPERRRELHDAGVT